jgi:hypothetical protein
LELYLWGTKVSDSGLAHLKRLTNLVSLELGNTQVSTRQTLSARALISISV